MELWALIIPRLVESALVSCVFALLLFYTNYSSCRGKFGSCCDQSFTRRQKQWIKHLTKLTDANSFGMLKTLPKVHRNNPKNRYGDIFPYNVKRVTIPEDISGSDYINASPIKIGNHHLIASQGPMVNTCADHWSMIWHENVALISMVTGFVEEYAAKCFEYLPLIDRKSPLSDINNVESLELDGEIVIKLSEIGDSYKLIMLKNFLYARYRESKDYRVTGVTSTNGQEYFLLPGGVALNLDGNYGITTKYGKPTSVTDSEFKLEITDTNEVNVLRYGEKISRLVVNEYGQGHCKSVRREVFKLDGWNFIKIPVSRMIFERNLAGSVIERFTIVCKEVEETFSGYKPIFTRRTLKVTYETFKLAKDSIYENTNSDGEFTFLKKEKRTVQHLQFNAWPDHGAPKKLEFKQYFIKFLELIKNAPGDDRNPAQTLIHCSAGVGRTGTVLTFLQLLIKLYTKEFEQETLAVEINKLRDQRMLLVQTEEQFKFIRGYFEELAQGRVIKALIKALKKGNAESSSESNTLI